MNLSSHYHTKFKKTEELLEWLNSRVVWFGLLIHPSIVLSEGIKEPESKELNDTNQMN